MAFWTPPQSLNAPPLTSHTGFTLGNGSTSPAMASGVASMSGSTDNFYPAVWSTPVDTNSMFSQLTLNAAPAPADTGTQLRTAGAVVRCNSGFTQWVALGADASGTYILTATSGSGGTVTTRATYSAAASGDVLKLTAVGNVYTAYKNGVSMGTPWTDSSNVITTGVSNRLCGLYVAYKNFNPSTSLKLLTVGDLYPVTPLPDLFTVIMRPSTR